MAAPGCSPRAAGGICTWEEVLGGRLGDEAHTVAEMPDGGSDALIARFNADGEVLWQKTYGGSHNDGTRGITQLADGGFVLVGSKGGPDHDDVWVIALDENGEMRWERTHGTPGEDGAVSVTQAEDGGFAVAGYSQRPGMNSFDNRVLRLDEAGDMLWQRHFARAIFSAGTAISAAPQGGFLVAGISQQRSLRDSKSWVIRLDGEGQMRGP